MNNRFEEGVRTLRVEALRSRWELRALWQEKSKRARGVMQGFVLRNMRDKDTSWSIKDMRPPRRDKEHGSISQNTREDSDSRIEHCLKQAQRYFHNVSSRVEVRGREGTRKILETRYQHRCG